ncbi:MAG: HEAT repeat domain-containing protein [Oligoflexia bacterium]|nr:HEAT repeat domain-containing protein [Oligoflexia bacterium]
MNALGDIGNFNSSNKKILLDNLKNKNKLVRAYSARVLGKMPEEDVIETLIEALSDDSYTVKINLLNALYTIGNKVIPYIFKHVEIKINALKVVGAINDKSSVSLLQTAFLNEKK